MKTVKKNVYSHLWYKAVKNFLVEIVKNAAGNDEKAKEWYRIMMTEHLIGIHDNCEHGDDPEVGICK